MFLMDLCCSFSPFSLSFSVGRILEIDKVSVRITLRLSCFSYLKRSQRADLRDQLCLISSQLSSPNSSTSLNSVFILCDNGFFFNVCLAGREGAIGPILRSTKVETSLLMRFLRGFVAVLALPSASSLCAVYDFNFSCRYTISLLRTSHFSLNDTFLALFDFAYNFTSTSLPSADWWSPPENLVGQKPVGHDSRMFLLLCLPVSLARLRAPFCFFSFLRYNSSNLFFRVLFSHLQRRSLTSSLSPQGSDSDNSSLFSATALSSRSTVQLNDPASLSSTSRVMPRSVSASDCGASMRKMLLSKLYAICEQSYQLK